MLFTRRAWPPSLNVPVPKGLVQTANDPESIEHSVDDPASELNAMLKLEFLEYAAVFAITGVVGTMLSTVKL